MNITIFGASGNVGRLTVEEALKRGYSVVGVIHSEKNLSIFADNPSFTPSMLSRLTVQQADIHTAESVVDCIQQSQVVISALGSWGTTTKDIVTTGISNIIPAMEKAGIRRILSLTGAEAYDKGDTPGVMRRLAHTAASLGAGKILQDGEKQITLLRASTLDWTVLRSPVMTSHNSAEYSLTLHPMAPWRTIPRRAVAKALIDQAEKSDFIRKSPFIYKG
jgi:putative NADH-flavin reductase